jgi:DNA-binding MarR family transcriptional regulator
MSDARMTEALVPVDPAVAAANAEPAWLTEQETEAWMGVSTIAVQLTGVLDAQLQRDSDIGFFEYSVLAWLSMAPDRTQRMSQLAELTRGSLSRLSNVVKRLEHRGLVRRAPDPANGRYTNAVLTDAGWECVVRAAPGHVNAVRQFVFDPLSEGQVEALGVISGLIADRIRAGTPSAADQAERSATRGGV